MARKALRRTFKSTANLANLLPTGTVLAFQILSPTCTNLGRCIGANRAMTASLVALCSLLCFILNFTDSIQYPRGAEGNEGAEGAVRNKRKTKREVKYGLATFSGLWIFDDDPQRPPPPETLADYRIKFRDFIHAFTSVLVFAGVVLCDNNVVSCFYPVPSENMERVLAALPIVIGTLGSALFVVLPTTHHGIGFPLSSS